MGVDLRPHISDDYPNAGQSIGNTDAAWAYDCQLECLKITARDYGLGTPYNDAGLRALGQPATGNSGILFPTIANIAARAFPGLPTSIQAGNAATLRANISKGYMQHMAFWCDTNAWVPPKGAISYSHCCRCVADTGTGFWFQNPEPHPDFFLSDAQVNSLTDGEGVLVFPKSLIGSTYTSGGDMGLVAFTYRPSNWGSSYVDLCYIQPDVQHVLHAWGTTTDNMNQEDIGGWADERAGVSCGWSPGGDGFIVQCVSSDNMIWKNWWNGQWTGWGHSTVTGQGMTVLLPPRAVAGPKGDKGDPGTTLDQATVDAMVAQSVTVSVPDAVTKALATSLDPKAVAAVIEAAMKQITGS